MTRHPGIPRRTTARFLTVGLLAVGLVGSPAQAQDKPDPIVARIGTDTIHLSEVIAAADTLPPQARQTPRDQLLPRVLDQIVDTRVLAIEARKIGLDKDPVVQRVLRDVQERALVSAMLEKEVSPRVTDAVLKERFDKEIGAQPPVVELHARHILVEDEAAAKKIIAELKKGGDFAALSKQYSKDAAAVEQGGDLGYFKTADMVPEFSAAAFALKDKEIGATPVHTQFGWHVIQALDRRTATPPPFEQVKDQLRQGLINDEVRKVLARARTGLTVERFNMDGTPIRAADQAVLPPAK
ncbi:MAG: peptidylprolyl isomerase [Acetobacteraceae bacterium]|nr:peptidylprolyl isomerase [Acetobacteraceae bacterium]